MMYGRNYDPEDLDTPRVTILARRHRTSRRGTAWCGGKRAGHFIAPGARYTEDVAIVDGEFEAWKTCWECEAHLQGYDLPLPAIGQHPSMASDERE